MSQQIVIGPENVTITKENGTPTIGQFLTSENMLKTFKDIVDEKGQSELKDVIDTINDCFKRSFLDAILAIYNEECANDPTPGYLRATALYLERVQNYNDETAASYQRILEEVKASYPQEQELIEVVTAVSNQANGEAEANLFGLKEALRIALDIPTHDPITMDQLNRMMDQFDGVYGWATRINASQIINVTSKIVNPLAIAGSYIEAAFIEKDYGLAAKQLAVNIGVSITTSYVFNPVWKWASNRIASSAAKKLMLNTIPAVGQVASVAWTLCDLGALAHVGGPMLAKYVFRDKSSIITVTILDNGQIFNGSDDSRHFVIGLDGLFELNGGKYDDTLIGGDHPDTLNGGAGFDTLVGGAGFDEYTVGNGMDTIVDDQDGEGVVYLQRGVDERIWLKGGRRVFRDDGGSDMQVFLSDDGRFSYTFKPSISDEIGTLYIRDLKQETVEEQQKQMLAEISNFNITKALKDGFLSIKFSEYEEDSNPVEPSPPLTFVVDSGNRNNYVLLSNTTAGQTVKVITGGERDYVVGGQGQEVLDLGDGNDRAATGLGNDYIYGGKGTDCITAGPVDGSEENAQNDADTIVGGGGADLLSGGIGDDIIYCDEVQKYDPADTVDEKGDWVVAGKGDDQIYGSRAHDFLNGGAGKDTIMGNAGNDIILGDGDVMFKSSSIILPTSQYIPGYFDAFTGMYIPGTTIGTGLQSTWNGTTLPAAQVVTQLLTVNVLSFNWSMNNKIETDQHDVYDFEVKHDWWDADFVPERLAEDGGVDTIDGGKGDDWIAGQTGGDIINGGAGDDIIFGDDLIGSNLDGSDIIKGGIGTDIIFGGGRGDIIDGGDDRDYIYGDYGSFTGYDGDDIITGGAGDDYIYGGGGIDNIDGGADNDVIYGDFEQEDPEHDGDDTISGGDGRDIIFGGGGNDRLFAGINILENEYTNETWGQWLDESDDRLFGGSGNDLLFASGGNDHLYGEADDDHLYSSRGNNLLDGGTGKNSYYYTMHNTFNHTSQDIIRDADGEWNIYLAEVFDDYKDNGGGNTINIKDIPWRSVALDPYSWYYQTPYGEMSLQVVGSDLVLSFHGLVNPGKTVIIENGASHQGFFDFGLMEEGNRAPVLIGGFDPQRINPGDSFTWTIPTGAFLDYNNDELTYLVDNLPGWLTFDQAARTISGIAPASGSCELTLKAFDGELYSQSGILNIKVNTPPTLNALLGDQTIEVGLAFSFTIASDTFTDADGDSLSYLISNLPDWLNYDQDSRTLSGTPPAAGEFGLTVKASDGLAESGPTGLNIIVVEPAGPGILYGTPQDDVLTGSNGAGIIDALAGDDKIFGLAGDDTLIGREGRDYLDGGEGGDIYVFNIGDGIDTISNYDTDSGFDIIKFGQGITPGDVILSVGLDESGNYNHLIITFATSHSDQITVLNHFLTGDDWAIDALEFADGQIIDRADILEASGFNKFVIGTEGSDTLVGTAEADKILGLGGNDTLSGRAGDDVMYGEAGNDSLDGEAGNDALYGGEGDDILDGGAGNDHLAGGAGNDVYVFGKGYGQDTVDAYDTSTSDKDSIRLVGLSPEEVEFGLEKDADGRSNFVVRIKETGESLTVLNGLNGNSLYGVDSVEFGDGTVWTLAQVLANGLHGTAADENLALPQAGALHGGGGNDRLYHDILLFATDVPAVLYAAGCDLTVAQPQDDRRSRISSIQARKPCVHLFHCRAGAL
jgi:Ca2+-binding RTX toxin-like protein